jgi:hypothetical protein
MVAFRKAERKQAKLKLALTGPSGSGKTYSALCLASGIGTKIAVIDTENGSASLYADRFEFDTVNLTPPYTIQKYIDAIKAAEMAGYEVVVIDSITHAWAGEGGLLAKKEALDVRGGNSYTNWAGITKEHEQFKAVLLNTSLHLIATMRSKQDYILEQNEKGKQAPKKVGLAPIQRDGMEYEFTTVFDIAMDHNAAVSKDRTSLFDGQIFKITKDTGKVLMNWLSTAKAEDSTTPVAQPPQEGKEPQRPESTAPSQTGTTTAPSAAETTTPPAASTATNKSDEQPKTPQRSGVACKSCASELILHRNGLGYICPNTQGIGDGHSRFAVGRLADFQKSNPLVKSAS